MIRRTTLAIALALGIAPLNVSALGLGDIQLNSALNQYLDADIRLLSVTKDEIQNVRVNLASAEAFERAGVERSFILTKLRFKPELRPDGSATVRVSSRDPIREPFLNFLVEINWPKGKLVREYTVLLDPPVTLDRKPAPVAAPKATMAPTPKPAPVTRPQHGTESVVSGSDVAWAGDAEVADEYGPTQRNDTLWGIAKKVRHEGASMQQAMISLFKANPQAFSNNNINNLKVGQIIRVPKRDEMVGMSRRGAQQVYSEHLNAWQADRAPKVAEAPKPEPAAPEAEAVADEAKPEAELKIATARPEGEGEAGPSETGEAAQTLEKLQQDLVLAQEEKESALQEGIELKSWISDLESQLEDLERLLTLKSEQLAQLQATATSTTEPAAPEPAPEAAPAVAETKPEPAPAPAPVAEAKPEPKPAVAEPPKPQLTAKPKKEREKGFMEKVMEDPTMLGVGIAVVVVLLALVWVVISRRRSSSADSQESILVSTIDDTDLEVIDEAEGVEKQADDTSFLSDFSPSDIDALQDETGEVDPLAETDVYIAYGRYQQAEELITQAIEKDPERIELRHKLFEILFAVKDADKYVKFAEECKEDGIDSRDPAAWEKVVAMGAQLAAGHELFAGFEGEVPVDVEAAAAEEQALEEDFDLEDISTELDLEVGEEGEESEEEDLGALEAEAESADELGDLDFDLEADTEEADVSEEVSLDFDESEFSLDLDTETTETAEAEAEKLDEGEVSATEEVGETDEVSTKLDLARAYIDMGDNEGAQGILQEVVSEGGDEQKQEAQQMLDQIS
ncbi:FimV/HubP family polar landmark protein [Solemya velesiana gill symbiont]|uniref:LysM domain-containing protein n=1 Tax=Solemya velesiana gill symbiont TaxID=1918948 RepID=A0A1T2KUU8_9GAMM|nr:FimV/HubP family polar landmark protein [Solemya velesiana gill symbiont]OOZ36604.1 hypothetical protein BOW51_06315 [Solemya velesiana gill symbiont]